MPFDLNLLATEVHKISTDHGFRGLPGDERPIPEHVALIHSEVTEILEDWRAGLAPAENTFRTGTNGLPKPCGIPSECADVILRVLNLCGEYGIDIEDAIRRKVAYNRTRPQLHGGKKI